MPLLAEILVTLSLLGALIFCVWSFFKHRNIKKTVLQLLLLLGLVLTLHVFLGFPNFLVSFTGQTISKGRSDGELLENWPMYVVSYVAMILGMLSQYVYAWLTKPQGERPTFDWGSFVAPLLVSPIVFVPLFGTLNGGEGVEKSNFMIVLVAFENGFFFKSYFDQRAKATQVQAAGN